MSTHNICFYEENQKIILQKHHLICYAELSLKSALIRLIFYYKFVQ